MPRSAPLLFVNYHYIRPRDQYPYPGIHPITIPDLAEQADALLGRLHPATPDEVAGFVAGTHAFDRPAFLLTFDDGLWDHLHAAEQVLAPRGLRAAFFVCSRPLVDGDAVPVQKLHWLRATMPPAEFLDDLVAVLAEIAPQWCGRVPPANADHRARYPYDPPEVARVKMFISGILPAEVMETAASALLARRGIDGAGFAAQTHMDAAALRQLDGAGHIVGVHGHAHRRVPALSWPELDREIGTNIDCLTAILGRRPTWHAYPYGRPFALPEDPGAFGARYGFDLALTLTGTWNTGAENRFRLHRVNTNDVDAALAELATLWPG